MINTPAIAALIRDNKTFRINSDIQTGGKYGMVTLDSYLVEKHMQGIISRDEVLTKAQDLPTVVQKLAEWDAAQAEEAAARKTSSKPGNKRMSPNPSPTLC